MSTSRVTVLMPCFNGARYLREAIRSVQEQTFRDWNLTVIDDGSTDKSAEIAAEIADRDQRVRVKRNGKNLGLSQTRNRGIDGTDSEYIAWLDCDDLSTPQRLECQVRFLEKNPTVGLLGSWVAQIDSEGITTGKRWILNAPEPDFGAMMLFRSYCWQSAVMLRRSALGQLRYDQSFSIGEDYDFHARLSDVTRGWNLPEILCRYRSHSTNITKTAEGDDLPLLRILTARLALLGVAPTDAELAIHKSLFNAITRGEKPLKDVESWLLRLWQANLQTQRYSVRSFSRVLLRQWLYTCWSQAVHPACRAQMFWRGELLGATGASIKDVWQLGRETAARHLLGGRL